MWQFWLIFGLILAFMITVSYTRSPKFKGILLENKIHKILEKLALKYEGYAFKDLLLPFGNATSQIDNVLITPKAIFVIEAKNYKGRIFGSIHQEQWTMTSKTTKTYKNKRGKTYQKSYINKYQFYNPIKQNETHIRGLQQHIKTDIPFYNLVVFGPKANLSELKDNLHQLTTNFRKLNRFIQTEYDHHQKSIKLSELDKFKDILINCNILDKKQRKAHVKNIRNTYN